jgi:hypothetical protein
LWETVSRQGAAVNRCGVVVLLIIHSLAPSTDLVLRLEEGEAEVGGVVVGVLVVEGVEGGDK